MNNSIYKELRRELKSMATKGCLTLENKEQWHHIAFKERRYVGHHAVALEWLTFHEIDAFDAIGYVIEQEREMFDQVKLESGDISPDKMVNWLVYYAGYEALECMEDKLESYLQAKAERKAAA